VCCFFVEREKSAEPVRKFRCACTSIFFIAESYEIDLGIKFSEALASDCFLLYYSFVN